MADEILNLSEIPVDSEGTPLKGNALIQDYVKRLPDRPGVYRMIGEDGGVLYVGKAKSLKKRVTSYTQFRGHSNRIIRMISETRSMEFVVTQTETSALLLEANLIKQLKPRYNVLLRDDKSFPHILIAADHDAPQILKHRGARKRPGKYFGPFASAGAVNQTLNTLQKAFLLRSCTDSVYDSRTRPCLLHQIKRCSAPCVGLISMEDYEILVNEAQDFLSGKNSEVQKFLSKKMEQASEELNFEGAAALRDRIRALSFVQGTQNISATTFDEADIFAMHQQEGQTCIQVFFFRVGQNWGNHAYYPRHDRDISPKEIMNAFMAQFYDNRQLPSLVLTNVTPTQHELLTSALSTKADRKITITTPQRGEKLEIVNSAVMNAKEALARRLAEKASQLRNRKALAKICDLPFLPTRIEVYDNSHVQGSHAVGGMIVSGPDGFMKNQYRKFNIKNKKLTPGDDYGMMREVLSRRFLRLLSDKDQNHTQWPDLIVLDGGKGQLSAALDVFTELELKPGKPINKGKESAVEHSLIASIDNDDEPQTEFKDEDEEQNEDNQHTAIQMQRAPFIISIAKPKRENEQGQKSSDRTMGATNEQIFLPGRAPFLIPPRDPALFFIQRLRDEAHRFAISAHRDKRKKAVSANPLDDIAGVGAARKKALLHHFGSAKAIAGATVQDLSTVDGISTALAQKIFDFFNE